jgi:hypothetical protein
MPILSKSKVSRHDGELEQLFRGNTLKARLGLAILMLACSAVAAAEGDSGELAPKIPETANAELKFGSNDLAAVIAVDEQGNYKLFRSRKATEPAKEQTLPMPAKEMLFLETFTVFKMNPTCIHVNGQIICW